MKVVEADRIDNLEDEIKKMELKVVAYEKEIFDFERSLAILKNTPDLVPAEDFDIFQQLQQIINEDSKNEAREKKINQCEKSLQLRKSALNGIKGSIEILQARLAEENAEKLWQQEYQPHAKKFEAGFPQPIDQNAEKIASIERDLIRDRANLKNAENWLAAPDGRKPRYSLGSQVVNPQEDFHRLTARIAALETNLERLKALPKPERDEKSFRAYITGRVDIEENLQKFLKAQAEYFSALENFKNSAIRNEHVLNFSLGKMHAPGKVIMKDGKIILSFLE